MSVMPPPLVISQSDLEDGCLSTAVKSFECDCACPDNGFALQTPSASGQAPLRCAPVYRGELADDHVLMFNPLRESGVMVLNRTALELWQDFQTPRDQEYRDHHLHSREIAKMAELGLLEEVETRTTMTKGAAQTLSVWMHVTNQCNLRCQYCYINKTSERMDESVGAASVEAVFRSALKGGFTAVKIKFAGGEATLNPDLVMELDRQARERARELHLDYESVILSNGVMIGERLISECLERGMRVMISLDGVGAAHDRQRHFADGRGSFAQVERTIETLIEKGLRPFISITVTDHNTEDLPETVRFVLEKGLRFNLNFVRDNSCIANHDELRLRDDKVIAAIQRAFAVIESKLPRFDLLGMLVDRSNFNQPHDRTCGVGESYLVIDQKGQVSKCHMEIEQPVTNVYAEDPLADIKTAPTGVQNLRVEEKEGCRECEWRYWCTGGCPKVTFRATGRYDVKSPYCRIYKAIYPELLKLEGLRLLRFHRLEAADQGVAAAAYAQLPG